MDINQLLLTALQLLGLGMAFVFLFLGLLMVVVNLMAKYIPADQPVVNKKRVQQSPATMSSAESSINPALIAAITTAVHQYHKTKTA
ncbi:MAG: oxaloacetate decarboxylase gamma subunit [Psychromonas sp.]|jgi:oxaloacetate decarboxylase gamma subunit|uniref:oxaloacetate decarboxylase subunit gamma n=1 Tax=Psychromonas sp. TaxID=1884585 RepID=UPI0039E2470E